ncbi:hypothetical protein [Pseudomonas sp. NPDC007930]|uniref:hypothetical protein n=1 Tax=Pseudomonas sp. NPDC007930 TaxID=3364417 RepID=UPI0036E112DF
MRVEPRPLLPPGSEPAQRPEHVNGITPVSPRQSARFDALLGRRQASARKALRDEVEQASDLQALDPALFSAPRSLELLGHILDEVLPRLDLEPDIRALAEDLIREEIHMRHLLQGQRGEADEA